MSKAMFTEWTCLFIFIVFVHFHANTLISVIHKGLYQSLVQIGEVLLYFPQVPSPATLISAFYEQVAGKLICT